MCSIPVVRKSAIDIAAQRCVGMLASLGAVSQAHLPPDSSAAIGSLL